MEAESWLCQCSSRRQSNNFLWFFDQQSSSGKGRGSGKLWESLWQKLLVSLGQNHLQGLLKHRLLGPTPRISNSVGVGWGPGIYILTSFRLLMLLVQDHVWEPLLYSKHIKWLSLHYLLSPRVSTHSLNVPRKSSALSWVTAVVRDRVRWLKALWVSQRVEVGEKFPPKRNDGHPKIDVLKAVIGQAEFTALSHWSKICGSNLFSQDRNFQKRKLKKKKKREYVDSYKPLSLFKPNSILLPKRGDPSLLEAGSQFHSCLGGSRSLRRQQSPFGPARPLLRLVCHCACRNFCQPQRECC